MRLAIVTAAVLGLLAPASALAAGGTVPTYPIEDATGSASGTITNVRPHDDSTLDVTYTAASTLCDADGYCGWYAHGVQGKANLPCYDYDDTQGRLTYVGDFHEKSGQEGPKTDYFYPDSNPVKICLYVVHGTRGTLVAEVVYDAAARTTTPVESIPADQRPACSNLVDDDGDGQIDEYVDWGCTNGLDPTEEMTDADVPYLDDFDARKYVRRTLRAKKYAYGHASAKRIKCRKASSTRRRCAVSWTLANVRYAGKLTVSLRRSGETVRWRTRGTVRRTNTITGVVRVIREH